MFSNMPGPDDLVPGQLGTEANNVTDILAPFIILNGAAFDSEIIEVDKPLDALLNLEREEKEADRKMKGKSTDAEPATLIEDEEKMGDGTKKRKVDPVENQDDTRKDRRSKVAALNKISEGAFEVEKEHEEDSFNSRVTMSIDSLIKNHGVITFKSLLGIEMEEAIKMIEDYRKLKPVQSIFYVSGSYRSEHKVGLV